MNRPASPHPATRPGIWEVPRLAPLPPQPLAAGSRTA
jgi:hypothetical protein